MEQEDMRKCRHCQKEFSHGYGPADDPPLWLWYYCSEVCRLRDIRAEIEVMLMKIEALLDDGKVATRDELKEIIDSYRKKLRCEVKA